MPDAEFNYKSCTCTNGMRNGRRCGDCGGRGIVPKTYTFGAVPETVDDETEDAVVEQDDLENISVTHLRSRAKDLGVSAAGGKDSLVARIREAIRAERGEPEPDEDETTTGESDDDEDEDGE